MTQEEAIEKVRKLLALSKSDNEHEAALAASRAQEIMSRYALETAMLELDAPVGQPAEHAKVFNDPLNPGTRRVARWTIQLAATIAVVNGCKLFLTGPALRLVGRPSDANAVRYLFAYLVGEVNRIAGARCKGEGVNYANNFRLGMVETIRNRLKLERAAFADKMRAEASTASGTAIVRVEQALAQVERRCADAHAVFVAAFPRTTQRSIGTGGRYNPDARSAGRAAGHEVAFKRAAGALGQ